MITIGTVAKNIKEGDHILMRDGVARQVDKIHYQEDIIAFEMKRYEEKTRHFLFYDECANVVESW
jgi:hypothetical protein